MKASGTSGNPGIRKRKRGGFRTAPFPRPKDEHGRRHRGEEDPVAEHHVVQQVAVPPGEGEDDRPRSLEENGGRWGPVAGMQPRQAGKEEAIACHGLIDPGRDQDHQVQEPEGRDRDPRGDEAPAGGAEQRIHGIGRRSAAAGQPRYTQRAQVRQVGEQIDGHDDAHPGHQRAGQVALRLDQLLRHEVGLLPAAEGEQDRDQRGSHRQEDPAAGERFERIGGRWCRSQREPGNDQNRERSSA